METEKTEPTKQAERDLNFDDFDPQTGEVKNEEMAARAEAERAELLGTPVGKPRAEEIGFLAEKEAQEKEKKLAADASQDDGGQGTGGKLTSLDVPPAATDAPPVDALKMPPPGSTPTPPASTGNPVSTPTPAVPGSGDKGKQGLDK